MRSRIKTLARDHGKTVMLSTHILPDVRSVCEQVVMLVRGTVRLADSLENLSRPIEPTFNVSVYGDSSMLVEHVREQGHDVTVDIDGSLRVRGIADEQSSLIWKWATETGTSIRRLEPAVNSLDKIFFDAAGSSGVSTPSDFGEQTDSGGEAHHAGS
jgi:ABC-2 type transport system ATP-binding protein